MLEVYVMYNCPKTPEEKAAVQAEAAAKEEARIEDLKRSHLDLAIRKNDSVVSIDESLKSLLARSCEALAVPVYFFGKWRRSRRSYILNAGKSCGQGNPVRVQGKMTFVGHSGFAGD